MTKSKAYILCFAALFRIPIVPLKLLSDMANNVSQYLLIASLTEVFTGTRILINALVESIIEPRLFRDLIFQQAKQLNKQD